MTYEVDDEVVRSRHDDNGREGTREEVWVVGDALVLHIRKARSELVKCVSVFWATKRIYIGELRYVQRMSIAIVSVGVVAASSQSA